LCWLHGGDFYRDKCRAKADLALLHCADRIGREQGGAAYRWFKDCPLPILAVRGNHDSFDAWGFFQHAQDITGMVVRIAPGLLVAGIGWHGDRYYDTPADRDLQPACRPVERIFRRIRQPKDRVILLTHYPAYAPPPDNVSPYAHEVLQQLAAVLRPVAIIQGHIHNWFGMSHQVPRGTAPALVVNPGPLGGILSVDTQTGKTTFTL